MLRTLLVLLAVGLIAAVAADANAEERTYFSAYITQAYMRAVKNEPRGVDNHGSLDATSYSLNLRFRASDELTLATELAAKTWALLGGEAATSLDPELKVAAGSYRLSDSIRVTAGIQRAPLALYGEVRDLGIAVQSFMPMLYLPMTGFAPESYRGVSLGYYKDIGGVAIDAQLFFGELQAPAYELDPPRLIEFIFKSTDYREIATRRLRNTVGGRLNLSLFDDAVLLSASGYSGHDYDQSFGERTVSDQETNAWSCGAILEGWGFQLRGEYAFWNRNAPELDAPISTYNLYASWTVPIGITVYLSMDRTVIDEQLLSEENVAYFTANLGPEFFATLTPEEISMLTTIFTGDPYTDQEQFTVGLDWRPSPEISIKLEDYMMKGLFYNPDLETYDEFAHTLIVSVSYTFQ